MLVACSFLYRQVVPETVHYGQFFQDGGFKYAGRVPVPCGFHFSPQAPRLIELNQYERIELNECERIELNEYCINKLNEYERTELNGYTGIELNKYFW